jgi:ADP-heptose:LPS heptosyltransferase
MKKIEIFFKNIFLKLLVLFNPVKKQTELTVFNSKSNLLFIRLNRIGDALVTTPLLWEIKQQLGCQIIVLADKKNHFVFKNNPSIDKVIVFNKKLSDFFNFNKLLKDESIEAIVDLHDDVSTTVSFLVAIAKIRLKFGLKKSNYSVYSHTVEKLNPRSNHVIERILNLSSIFNLKIDKRNVSVKYFPTDPEKQIASNQLEQMNPGSKFLIGINISAGSDARFWGVENYKKLLTTLSKYQSRIIIFCSEKDLHFAKQIIDVNSIYPTTDSFGIFASAILNLNFLITPDTSIVHIASIKRIPIFGLYVKYKTDDMIWSPYNTDFEYVETEEPTLSNVSFDEVKNKLIPFLEKHLNVKRDS